MASMGASPHRALAYVALVLALPGAHEVAAQAPVEAPPPPPPPAPAPVIGPGATADRPPPPPSGYGETAPAPPQGTPPADAPIYPAPAPPPPRAAGAATYAPPPTVTPPATEVVVRPYDGGPVPEGARLEGRRRPGLYIPGVVVFTVAYGTALYEYILHPDDPHLGTLAIPIIGPIVYGSKINDVNGTLVMNSLLQATGALLFGLGMRRRQVLVFDVGSRVVALRPSLGPGSVGLGVLVH